MTLYDIGYSESIATAAAERSAEGFQIARVISEQKERYCVFTEDGEYDAEITGNMRFTAQSREDFPAVGDWVLVSAFENNFAVIHAILPRQSAIKRKSPERDADIQIIATNIDYALIVQAADRDFNLNRMERYLAICSDSRVQSIIVITKIDLLDDATSAELFSRIKTRVAGTPIIMLSNVTRSGLDSLREVVVTGKTYCLLGSSGVGKSTLLNSLCGRNLMKTGAISDTTNKGKHTTSYRELVVLDQGGILIDNPGMREVGMTDNDAGLDRSFSGIAELAQSCRFSNCTHTAEKGCAVLAALENGELGQEAYDNFLKLENEKLFFASSAAERRKKDKDFGKMLKTYKKDKSLNKF